MMQGPLTATGDAEWLNVVLARQSKICHAHHTIFHIIFINLDRMKMCTTLSLL